MKASWLTCFAVCIFSLVANADFKRPNLLKKPHRFSAHRPTHTNYKSLLNQHLRQSKKLFSTHDLSAAESAVPLQELDTSIVNTNIIPILAQLGFEFGRDRRFLTDNSHANFLRRSTWLYPDDGCWARAELLRTNFKRATQQEAFKVFAFGNLIAKTKNSPEGQVSWWYHVAPLIKVQNELYVLDPALSPQRPLSLMQWLSLMGDVNQIKVAVCMPHTYSPSAPCLKPSENSFENTITDQSFYLDQEWERLISLNRVPEKELGEHPPWYLRFRLMPQYNHELRIAP